jgi:signal peptidase I
MNVKEALKKSWYFIWESDSYWSLLANVILAIILVKFIVYPGLGLLFGTGYPVVAVVSGSMEHDGSFDEWWSSAAACDGQRCNQSQWYALHDISKEEFEEYSFKNGFNKGDIMVLYGIEPKNIKTGDVIVFVSQENGDPIIHRVITISSDGKYVYMTKGDHNNDSGSIDKNIPEDAIIGKAVFRIPVLGWIKIIAVELLKMITRY